MARNDVYLNINSLSPADAVVTGQQDMTAATIPELVLGDTPTFNFYFTDNTNVWPSWAGNAAYTLTWALSDAVAGDFAPAATTGNATPITGGWSVVLPLNSYDLVGLLNTKRVGQPYPVQNLWQQLRVTDPSGNEITRAMVWTPVRYRAISDTQNTESASPTGGRFVTVNNVNELTTPTDAQFYAANPVPTSALGTASNGQLFIGNGTGFTKATLTAGTGVAITNGSGSITIDATSAQEILTATVTNAEATPITKGQVVYIFGATGNRPSVKLAYNTGDATSAKTFGVVSDASIAAGGTGTVTCVGVVDGLNLGTYSDGDTVYLGATPGSITATKPYAPNHLVYVGIIERANAGNGELYVRIQNGYELDEIHDVQILTPPAAGSLLIRDNTLSLWKAATLTAGTNIAVTNGDAAVTVGLTGTVAVANGGTGVTTSTGTGSVVLSNTPTLTTPNIGAATGTSFNLTGSGTLGTTLTVSGTTDSSSKDTGAIVTEGGLGVEKSATFGGNLTVSGGTIGTAASTNLTLNGGSSGASLVLGQGTSADITITPKSVTTNTRGLVVLGNSSDDTNLQKLIQLGSGQAGGSNINAFGVAFNLSTAGEAASAKAFFGFIRNQANGRGDFVWCNDNTNDQSVVTTADEVARLTRAGNLLLGTTTDGGQKLQVAGTASFTSVIQLADGQALRNSNTGPSGVFYLDSAATEFRNPNTGYSSLAKISATKLEVFPTTASSSTTTGALVVSGGVGVAGAIFAGGTLQSTNYAQVAVTGGDTIALCGNDATNTYYLGVNYLNNRGTETVPVGTSRASWRWSFNDTDSTGNAILGKRSGGAAAGTFTDLLTITQTGDATFAGKVTVGSDVSFPSGGYGLLFGSTRIVEVVSDGINIVGSRIRISTDSTPASASAAGTKGDIKWDASYIYVCTATNTWKRVAIATWP